MKNSFRTLKYNTFNLASFIKFLDISFYIINIILFIYIILWVLLFIISLFGSTVYCDGDLDKFLETAKGVKDAANNVNSNISSNNVNINVSNPDLNVHNPNINIPHSWGQHINQAASSIGIGATVVAGINGMARVSRNMSPVARAATLGGGGVIGAVIYAGGNYLNTRMQNNLDPNKNSVNNNKDGPFPAKSIIEEGDSVDNIINFLYFNLFISICIFLLLVLLLYLYRNKKDIYVYITWIFLVIFSYISVYLAYNLVEDIDIIAKIYQSNTSVSVVNYSTLNPLTNEVKETKEFLYANFLLSATILILLYALFSFYISSKIINGKWNFSFIEKFFGKRLYYYFMKMYLYGSKTNQAWMIFSFILLIIASIVSMILAYSLIKYIDLITELYEHYKNK
jgi:hypothetical protein